MCLTVDRRCLSVQVPCATLHDVISFLVDKTEGVLIPLIIEEAYEKSICTHRPASLACCGTRARLLIGSICLPSAFVRSDRENGEKSVQQAPVIPVPPVVPPKPGSGSKTRTLMRCCCW